MPLSIKAEIEQRKAQGNFFRKDVTKTMMQNALDAVEWLADEGAKMMRANVPVGSGFTRDNIEGFTYKRVQMVTGRDVQSRFGKTRLLPGLSRSPGSPTNKKYSAQRRPYITMSVLETGHYGAHPRQANWHVRKTFRRMKAYERSIRRDITEGLT